MDVKIRTSIILSIALAVSTIFLASCATEPRPEVGSPAPAANLRDITTGETREFPGDWSGRAVAASFFSPG